MSTHNGKWKVQSFKQFMKNRLPGDELPKVFKIVERQNFKCAYCDLKWDSVLQSKNSKYTVIADINNYEDSRCSIDHVIPRGFGGLNHDNNKVACCNACNQLKGDTFLKSRQEFIEYRILFHVDELIKETDQIKYCIEYEQYLFPRKQISASINRHAKQISRYLAMSSKPVDIPEDIAYIVKLSLSMLKKL